MDFGKALTYPFDDQDWVTKLGIGVGIIFASFILSFLGIGLLLLGIVNLGWTYSIAKNVRQGVANPLPEWDFGTILGRGATIFGAALLYQIPAILFICVGVGASIGLASNEDLAGAASAITACCSCLALIYGIVAGIVLWAGMVRYIDNEEFSTFMAFGDNFALFQQNLGDFLTAFLVGALGGFLISLVAGIIPIIGTLIGIVISITFQGHILGQLGAKVLGSRAV